MKLYRIESGCTPMPLETNRAILDAVDSVDWVNSCIVAAESASGAVIIAEMYDIGLIQPDQLCWPDAYGATISVLFNSAKF
jgi:hypothetical protein